MNTVKIKKSKTKIIAHRGLSGLEAENTVAAFVAAGNRNFYGIETDVRLTRDQKFIIIHDSSTARVCEVDLVVQETELDVLREIKLYDKNGLYSRGDLVFPTVEEYFSVCKKYDKKAILELKSIIAKEDIVRLVEIAKEMQVLDNVIFISFHFENLVALKSEYPKQAAQYLVSEVKNSDELISDLKKYKLGIDIWYGNATKELIDLMHSNGILVNAWTVDKVEDANRLIDYGIDFITTNILESEV